VIWRFIANNLLNPGLLMQRVADPQHLSSQNPGGMIRCSHGKSRMLWADGSYVRAFPNAGGRPSRNGAGFNVQEFFLDLAERSPLQEAIAVAVSAA
jgi:hypothetical protein